MKKYFRKGNALLGFVNFGRNKEGQFGIHPVWGRVFVLLCGLAVAAWITVALAAFLFLKHTRDIETGRFADLLFFRWEEYRVAWGEDYIRRGKELIEDNEFAEGFHFLRVGVGRSPENIEGRLLLANLMLAQNRSDRGARLLMEGLPYGVEDTDYLTSTLRVLLLTEQDTEIRQIAEEYLPEEPVMEDRYIIIAFAAARASFHRGDFDHAVQLINDYRLGASNNGRILLARIDWERGRRSEALERLEEMARQRPDSDEVYVYLTRYHHELGNVDAAERYAVIRQLNNPLGATPRIDLLYIYHETGDTRRLEQEIDSLLREFRGDVETIHHLAQFALDIEDVGLARRILDHTQARNMDPSIPGIVLVHSLIQTGQYEAGQELAERLSQEVDHFEENFRPQLLAIAAIANYAAGDRANGDLNLNQFLSAGELRPSNYITYADKLVEIGYPDVARRILAQAQRNNPRSQSLLTGLIRLDMARGDGPSIISNIRKLMDMRLPSPEVLTEAYLFLSSDRFLYSDERLEILEALESTLERHPLTTVG